MQERLTLTGERGHWPARGHRCRETSAGAQWQTLNQRRPRDEAERGRKIMGL